MSGRIVDGSDAAQETAAMTFWHGPLLGPLTQVAAEMVRRGYTVEQALNVMAFEYEVAAQTKEDGDE